MKTVTRKLLKLAKNAERIEAEAMKEDPRDRAAFGCMEEPSAYTCNAIMSHVGVQEYSAYRQRLVTRGDEPRLWRDPDCPSIRVMLLCFAAAMAETGDLTVEE